MNNDDTDNKLAQLDRELSALKREIEPERDLWPGIESELSPKPQSDWRRLRLAAAVCLAVLTGSAFWVNSNFRDAAQLANESITPPVTTPLNTVPIAVDRPRMQLVSYTGGLFSKNRETDLSALQERIATLPPAERDVVKASLAIIDLALSDIDAALAVDPGNKLLRELLLTTYQKELDTIATVNRSTVGRATGTTRGDL